MIKKAGSIVGSLLLIGLTVAVAAWAFRTTSSERFTAAVVAATPGIPTVHVQHPRGSATAFHAGVSVVVYGNDPYFQPKAQVLLNRLADLGVNSVSLVIPVFQDGPTGSQVFADAKKTPSDVRISTFVNEARRRGFTVMLRPLLDIGVPETPADWRGSIHPSDVTQWRQSYSALILDYARLAARDQVAIFDLGSELDSMEPNTAFWQHLIASARAAYHGQITYSSNWAKWYPAFGSSLDFISIDAYFPLNRPATASAADLADAWQQWINRMRAIARDFDKPLVLTELGATSLTASFQQPWVWDNGQPIDLTAQQRYYQAACSSVVPRFAGVYWWMYSLDPPAKPVLDRSYTAAGKPAEADLKACFTR
ncbi:MAG TPA: hypothetical protein VIT43_05875 [Candidatus Dormibacteraeota bacterium]